VQDGTVFRDVGLVTPEHGVDACAQARCLGQLQEEPEGFINDTVFRVIQEETHRLNRHTLTACGIIREELAEVQCPDLLMVGREGLPGWALGNYTTLVYKPRIAKRYHIIRPLPGECLDSSDHLFSRQRRPRGKPPRFVLSGGEDLDVGPADINNQHIHGASSHCCTKASLAFARVARMEAITSMRSPRKGHPCEGGVW
jgi:hypothetical protein